MENNSPMYITEAPPNSKENPLKSYVNMLDSKLDYAKWKQDLVLNYNYMPLANIKQKLQSQRVIYQKKMLMEQAKLRALVDNEYITNIMNELKRFRNKLSEDSEKLAIKIETQRQVVKKLQQKVSIRKQKLKSLLKNNRDNIRLQLIEKGIKTERDIKSLVRSKSTLSNVASLTSRIPQNSQKNLIQYTKEDNIKQLFQNCVQTLQKNEFKKRKKEKTSGIKRKNDQEELLKHYRSVPTKIEEPFFKSFEKKPFPEISLQDFCEKTFQDTIQFIYQKKKQQFGKCIKKLLS